MSTPARILLCTAVLVLQTSAQPASQRTAPIRTSTVTTAPASPAPCTAPIYQRPNIPYIAKQQTTRTQTLADGTHITTVTQEQLYRDAQGRTRTDFTRTLPDGTPTSLISIFDPVARIRLNWNSGPPSVSKTVNVQRIPCPTMAFSPQPADPNATPRRYYPTKVESLPPQTIAGVYVEGTRNTRTIPAGYENNDRDIITVNENWYAPGLALQMRFISDDPRNGKTTREVTDLQQIPPDPALFKIPEGYTIRENPQQ